MSYPRKSQRHKSDHLEEGGQSKKRVGDFSKKKANGTGPTDPGEPPGGEVDITLSLKDPRTPESAAMTGRCSSYRYIYRDPKAEP